MAVKRFSQSQPVFAAYAKLLSMMLSIKLTQQTWRSYAMRY